MSRRFNRLAGQVAREYERKGYSPSRARYIGRAVAGRVAHQREGVTRMAHGHGHKKGCRCRFCTMSAQERMRHLREAQAARRRRKSRGKGKKGAGK